jgi:hypothetical protein
MTDQAHENQQPPTPLGVSSSEGLGLAPERAAFEAWASRNGWAESDLGDKCAAGSPRADEYRHQGLQDAWEVWTAAVAQERERCAKLVEEMDTTGHDGYIETTGDLCDALAGCIRRGLNPVC